VRLWRRCRFDSVEVVGRCRFDSVEVEGRVAGARAAEAVGEASAQGRCQVTAGMVG
jgi:cytoskeletal protein CcmA (bactofilin family)